MRTARLNELPPSVVDEFVNMQLKKSFRSDENSPHNTMTTPGTPFKVEYRLIRKKKPYKTPRGPSEISGSPSSLRYTSPVPLSSQRLHGGQIILKPIEPKPESPVISELPQQQQPPIPMRKVMKTPELIKLSVQRLGSFDSVMFPVRASTETESLPRHLPPIEASPQNQQPRQPVSFGHKFTCPQCKCNIYKELVITLADEGGGSEHNSNVRSRSPERAVSNTESVTMATQTDNSDPLKTGHSHNKTEESGHQSHDPKNSAQAPVSSGEEKQKNHPVIKSNAKESPPPNKTEEKHKTVENSSNSGTIEEPPISVRSTVLVVKAVQVPPNSHDEEPVEEIRLSSDDLKLIEKCRNIAKTAESDGSVEYINSAIRQLAVIAQKLLSDPTKKGSSSTQHGRIVCCKIGDVLVDEGFSIRFYQILHGMVNGWEFFASEETYHITFNLYTDLTSFLNSSSELQANLTEQTKIVSQILSILSYKKYLNQLTQKNIWRFFDANLTILCHFSRNASLYDSLRSSGVVATCKKFLTTGEFGYVGLWLPSTVTMARLANDDEIAASIKGNLTDFIPTITGYIISYFSEKNDEGDDTSRSINFSTVEEDDNSAVQQFTNAKTMMPGGASVQLVELTSAFLHFLSIIYAKNENLDKDFYIAQIEFDEIVKCSIFLMKLPRPVKRHQQSNNHISDSDELTLGDWRHLVKSGLKMASFCNEICALLQLSFNDKNHLKEELIAALSNLTKMQFREGVIKREAESLLTKINKPRTPSPPPRSVTETIEKAKISHNHDRDQEEPAHHQDEQSQQHQEKAHTAHRETSPEASNKTPTRGDLTPVNHETTSALSESLWNSSLVNWNNSQVRSWIRSIGLEKYEDEFQDYDGSMLLALFDVRRESPQYFQKEIAAKLGGVFNNLLRFTAELTKLVANNQLATGTTTASTGTPNAAARHGGDQLSLAVGNV